MALEFTKSEAKKWAKKNMKGLEVPIFPSFTPDLEKLDEEGIRWDVNHIISNGFSSVFAAVEACGLTFEERKKFVEIVCKEVKGRIHVSVSGNAGYRRARYRDVKVRGKSRLHVCYSRSPYPVLPPLG